MKNHELVPLEIIAAGGHVYDERIHPPLPPSLHICEFTTLLIKHHQLFCTYSGKNESAWLSEGIQVMVTVVGRKITYVVPYFIGPT